MKRFAPLLLLIFTVAWPSRAQLAPPSAYDILQRARQASGGDAWNQFAECKSEGTIKIAGKTGPAVLVENLRTGASIFTATIPEAGVHQSRGFSPDSNWRLGDDGHVSLYTNGDPSQVDALYLTRHGYWQPNFSGAQVSVLDPAMENGATFDRLRVEVPGGRGFTLWINRANHFIERVNGETTKYLSDFRAENGVMLPFVQRDPNSGQEFVFTATKRTLLKNVEDADFAIPFKKDYQMPASGAVTLPAQGGIVFQAKVNGKGPYPVMFDTASVNLISAEFAKQLGLRLDGNPQKFGTPTEPIDAQTAHVDTLQIGDLLVRDQTFYVISIPGGAGDSPLVAVGYELMRRLVVKVDYEHEQLTFYDGPTFHYSGNGTRVPLLMEGVVFEAAGSVDDLGATFVLDTGNEVGFELEPAFVSQYNLVQRLGAQYHGYSGRSYGGPMGDAYYVRVKSLHLGDAEVHNVVAILHTGEEDRDVAGNIGRTILRQFNVTFDAMRGVFYLEKNANWGKPDIFNRAGIVVDPTDDGQKVMTVLPGSPAESAGIAAGDLITRIDGRAPDDDINDHAFLQPEGTRVALTVKRGDSVRDVELTLKNLL